jgi:hypothetical protein
MNGEPAEALRYSGTILKLPNEAQFQQLNHEGTLVASVAARLETALT